MTDQEKLIENLRFQVRTLTAQKENQEKETKKLVDRLTHEFEVVIKQQQRIIEVLLDRIEESN